MEGEISLNLGIISLIMFILIFFFLHKIITTEKSSEKIERPFKLIEIVVIIGALIAIIGLFIIIIVYTFKFPKELFLFPLFLLINGLVIMAIGMISESPYSKLEEKNAIYLMIIIIIVLLIAVSFHLITSLFIGFFISIILILWYYWIRNIELKEENNKE